MDTIGPPPWPQRDRRTIEVNFNRKKNERLSEVVEKGRGVNTCCIRTVRPRPLP